MPSHFGSGTHRRHAARLRSASHTPGLAVARGSGAVRRTLAAIGSAVFFLLAPGATAVLIPWFMTGWESNEVWAPGRVAGALLLAAGAIVLVSAFVRFVVEGVGHAGAGRADRAACCRWPLPLRAQPDVSRRRGDDRRAGAAARPAGAAGPGRRSSSPSQQPLCASTRSRCAPALRHPVRGLLRGRAGLVAARAPLKARPGPPPSGGRTVARTRSTSAVEPSEILVARGALAAVFGGATPPASSGALEHTTVPDARHRGTGRS
jgi:hypothetical protein